MDEIFALPTIARDDYETIRRFDGCDLPDSYNEWLNLHAKQKLERGQVGYVVQEIQINPGEFGRYCSARRIAANGNALLSFAAEKFEGNNY